MSDQHKARRPRRDVAVVGSSDKRWGGRGYRERLDLGEKVLAKRNVGLPMVQAARDLGISRDTAERCMKLALAERIPPTVDEFRRQQNDRLDQTQREIEANIETANYLARKGAADENFAMVERAMAMRSQAVALQIRLDERRAKLNGLDAPIQADLTVHTVDPADAELAELLREAQAKAAAQSSEVQP